MNEPFYVSSHLERILKIIRYAASVVMSMTYGKLTPTTYSDPEVVAINSLIGRMAKAMRPGRYLVDFYPILQYLPGYATELRKYHQEEKALFRSQVENVKQNLVSDASNPPSCPTNSDVMIILGGRQDARLFREVPTREAAGVPDF